MGVGFLRRDDLNLISETVSWWRPVSAIPWMVYKMEKLEGEGERGLHSWGSDMSASSDSAVALGGGFIRSEAWFILICEKYRCI